VSGEERPFNSKSDFFAAVALGSLTPARASALLGLHSHDPSKTNVADLHSSTIDSIKKLEEYKALPTGLGQVYTNYWGNNDTQAHIAMIMDKV
jgi:hypothetical protein